MKHALGAAALAAVLLVTSCSGGTPDPGGDPSGDPGTTTSEDTTSQSGEGEDAAPTDAAEAPTDAPALPADSVPPRASGEPVDPDPSLPAVTLDSVGAPSITPVDGEPPAQLVAQTLIKGTGAPVEENAQITAQYAGWLWDGTEFDSSWSRGGEPFTAALSRGSLIDGWVQGLVGQTVGSQVELIIPPELGYGDVDMGTIPPGSTLIFVIDIIDATAAS
jgi:peptidylprolyl isomerase